MFEYEVELPPLEGEIEKRKIGLQFKPFGEAPGRISRYNQGMIERQLWLTLEWGLEYPKNWPENTDLPGHLIFDEISQRDITDIYNAWQEAEDEESAKRRRNRRERREAARKGEDE